jgi:hypothetical protein
MQMSASAASITGDGGWAAPDKRTISVEDGRQNWGASAGGISRDGPRTLDRGTAAESLEWTGVRRAGASRTGIAPEVGAAPEQRHTRMRSAATGPR